MRSRSSSSVQPDRPKSPLWPLLLLLVFVDLAMSLYILPLNRVIELRLCQEHYNQRGPIPEKQCKIDEVQKRLAWIQGIMETTAVVCDAIVTIPFGFVAERFGIKAVLWCNLVPRVFLSVVALAVGKLDNILPTTAILAGPFTIILGGGCVFSSTVYNLTSGLAGEYVQRASYLSYITSVSYIINFIGPTLASFTMSRSLWLPFWINIVLLLCAVPTVGMLPDIRKLRHPPPTPEPGEHNVESARPLLDRRSPSPDAYAGAFETSTATPKSIVQKTLDAARTIVRLLSGRKNFRMILFSCFLTAIASSDTKLLVQYISKRYEWTFAQAGYMLSAKALVNVVLLTIVVPRIIKRSVSTKTIHGSEVRLNYIGAEVSIAISVIGVLCVALAFRFWMLLIALIIYAVGSALPIFVMSLIKSPIITLKDSEANNQDFSIMMLVKTLGALVGAPLMTVLWVQAIKIGGVGLGLPYFVSACVYGAAAFVIARLQF